MFAKSILAGAQFVKCREASHVSCVLLVFFCVTGLERFDPRFHAVLRHEPTPSPQPDHPRPAEILPQLRPTHCRDNAGGSLQLCRSPIRLRD